MIRVALAGLRTHALRTVLTAAAVALAVAFLAGTLIYRDTAREAFYDDLARPGVGVDVAVLPPEAGPLDPWQHVDPTIATRLAQVDGITGVDARAIAPLPLLGRNGRTLTNAGYPGWAVSSGGLYRLIDGRQPEAGETLLDQPTAHREKIKIGAALTVLDKYGDPVTLTVVGLADFGATRTFAGWSMLVLSTEDLDRLTDPSGYAQVVATGRGDPDALRERVERAIGPGYQVLSGAELRERLAVDTAKYVTGLRSSLLAAALVALLMACLVVANTFSLLIAQRTRELALLRCIGASRTQIFGLALGEAAFVGIVASAIGVAMSVVIAAVLFQGRGEVGSYLPPHALVVRPSTVGLAFAAGIAATVLSGLVPARSAGQISPLAALQPSKSATAPRRRMATAVVLAAGGLALSRSGLDTGFAGTPRVLAGGAIAFGALVLLLPLAVPAITAGLGWATRHAFGVPGRLAAANAGRNPRRAAAMATALMIGVAVMSMFSVLVATARVQGDRELAENFPADFVVRPLGDTTGPLPAGLTEALRMRTEFGLVASTEVGTVHGITAAAVAPDTPLMPEVIAGDLDELGPGRIAVRRLVSEVGGTVADFNVVAVYDDTPITGDALLDWSDRAQLAASHEELIIRRSTGTTAATARTALDEALSSYPLVAVESSAERRDALAEELDGRLTQLGILLVVSTVIALFGIMDTLSLAVLERTRESGTLRALGLGARQLRAMLAIEALLTALIGAALGVAFGLGLGWLAGYGLIKVYGHGTPTVPIGQLIGYAAVAGGVAVLASVLPARRAARASIVTALDAD